jgi:glycosyltransferase involved in cell wall biosynthesis
VANLDVQVVCCSKGRGRQMNAGAQRANGDMLLFLHADSQLPDGYDEAMQRAWGSAMSKAADAPPRCRLLALVAADVAGAWHDQNSLDRQFLTSNIIVSSSRWGCFESIRLGGAGASLRGWLVRSSVRWRTLSLGAPYGDQAIFVDRHTFRCA